jgi:hypothetical protein
MQKLTEEQIREKALEFGYDYAAIRAVIDNESAGRGFDPATGKLLIRFEPAVFKRYTGKLINTQEGQAYEWQAFENASKLDKLHALMSTSWGLGQLMGFNFKACGYTSAEQMVENFSAGEDRQLHGMLCFIKSNKRLDEALKALDWKTFAYYYNGPNYRINRYDSRLEAGYHKYKTLSTTTSI